MQPDALMCDGAGLARLPAAWRRALMQLAGVWLGLIVLFFADWRDVAGQWWGSSTYNHMLLVPPIVMWLVMQRRHEVLRLIPSAWWPGLIVFAGAGFVWLLGDFAGLSLARQLAVVVMAQAAVGVVLGPRVVAGLAFPLFYMLFMVPIGDEAIPFLQTVTARLTMVYLALAHVPATVDGVFITTRAGYFQVAEACSGVKFLIAMIAYGVLVANVCFVQMRRRVAFVAVSVVVPVMANGARAFGTIWIAGWWGVAFASGFDHLFYGWVFFAVVMALCMAVGWRFFDRPVDAAMIDPVAIMADARLARLANLSVSPRFAIAAMAAVATVFLGWGMVGAALAAPLHPGLQMATVNGWDIIPGDDGAVWVPLHGGADRHGRMRLRNAQGAVVDVSFALYANQSEGHEAGGFGQGALPQGTRWAWDRPGPAMAGAKSDVIQAPSDGPMPERRLCLTWYRSGALLTGSNLALRLHAMADHLLFRREVTAVLIVSASDRFDRDPHAAIAGFLTALGPVERWIAASGG